MYQTFTGNSRRPRQVNLSGRNSNPFAAPAPGAGGTVVKKAAIQDREQRKRQRDELNAAKKIQRVWRGHSSRRRTYQALRQQWDTQSGNSLNRLLLFFEPSKDEDVRRFVDFVSRASSADMRLERVCLAVLASRNSHADELLPVLSSLAASLPEQTSHISVDYYKTLSSLQTHHPALLDAVVAPLRTRRLSVYEAFAAAYLTHPYAPDFLDQLAREIDPQLLTQALSDVSSGTSSLDPRSCLWLLGQYIYLVHGELHVATNVPTVARLLASLAGYIDPQASAIDKDNRAYNQYLKSCEPHDADSPHHLNQFLRTQFSRLIDQSAIRSLISRSTPQSSSTVVDQISGSAQLLANYALTLLRMYPSRADDIRMWLYLGPQGQSHAEDSVPAIAYLWRGVRTTHIFEAVSRDPQAAVGFLKAPNPPSSAWQPPTLHNDQSSRRKSEWCVILIFLELFTFVLKIMDDEEFLGVSSGRRISNNALPISDIKDLTFFLKNLGFSMYFNSQDIFDSYEPSRDNLSPANLGQYFTGSATSAEVKPKAQKQQPHIAGIEGTTLESLKGLVTGLLRSIYERDSRRNFLPKGHWLMTSRFDMTNFIPAVVEEEERRAQLQKQADDDGDLEEDSDPEASPSRSSYGPTKQSISRNQRLASRRRYLEAVAPRLEILQNMPFFIPFETRVEIFREFVRLDQIKRRYGNPDPDMWRHAIMFNRALDGREELGRHYAKIRRKFEFEDAFDHFYELGDGLKEPIQITFLDEFGLMEAGIDGGGVTKEFLTSVTSGAFDPSKGFFKENSQHLLYPNPTRIEEKEEELRILGFPHGDPQHRAEITDLLRRYEFLGRVVGKCLYEGILIDIGFAGFFLLQWALFGGPNAASNESGYRPSINDVRELDEELYHGLLKLKYHTGNVEDWSTYFVLTDSIPLPDGTNKTVEHNLLRHGNGADTLVTNENRLMYISAVARWRLAGQLSYQTNAFLRGLSSIIQTSWLNMFNQSELQTLIGGAASSISISDLRRNTNYGGVYVIGDDGLEHPSVKLFWDVMESLDDKDKGKVLKFVTSTPRAPLLGFASLNPRFSIRDSGDDESRFPTTSTCINLLKLPRYKSAGTLRDKLLYAVNSGAGFDLS